MAKLYIVFFNLWVLGEIIVSDGIKLNIKYQSDDNCFVNLTDSPQNCFTEILKHTRVCT